MVADDLDFEELEKILVKHGTNVEELLACLGGDNYIKARDFKFYNHQMREKWNKLIDELRDFKIIGGCIGDMGGRWMYDLYRVRLS